MFSLLLFAVFLVASLQAENNTKSAGIINFKFFIEEFFYKQMNVDIVLINKLKRLSIINILIYVKNANL